MNRYIILFLFASYISGCSIGGGTESFVLPIKKSSANLIKNLNSVAMSSNKDASVNETLRAYNWGSYTLEDEENIRKSIVETIEQYQSVHTLDKYNVFVHVHRYSQVYTNDLYSSLVVVDWCISDDNKILFDEIFYAEHEIQLNIFTGNTLGHAKHKTNEAIVRRIVNRSLNIAFEGHVDTTYETNNVYLSAEEAVDNLPKIIRHGGLTMLVDGLFISSGTATKETSYMDKAKYIKVDWDKRIFGGP